MKKKNYPALNFKAKLYKIGSSRLLRLPLNESEKLPSRGMVLVEGTINDFPFQTVLDPDGKGSHWIKIDGSFDDIVKVTPGDTVTLSIKPSINWKEPEVPPKLKKSLLSAPEAYSLWCKITPMARWDWIRWIGSAQKADTREHRMETAIDKLTNGERRPCCFNRSLCTDPSVSKNGVLLDPS